MNKKLQVVIWSTIIISIVALNIYVCKNSSMITKYVNESNSHTQRIVLIDKFKSDINTIAQANKLYILTQKYEYKIEYEEALKNVYKTINELEADGSISSDEKNELIIALKDYSNINSKTMNINTVSKISEDIENNILKSNQSQLEVLNQLDKSVEETNKNVKEKNNIIESALNNQKGNVQVISTILTAIGSGILYYIKKNPVKLGKQVGEIIGCISNIEENTENASEGKQIDKNNKDIKKDEFDEEVNKIEKEYEEVKKCVDNIIMYEKAIEYFNLIYKQSAKMEVKINQSNEIIDDIFIYLNQLKINIEECKNCSGEIKLDLLNEIQTQLIELKILLETIPIYNEIIKDASNEIKY